MVGLIKRWVVRIVNRVNLLQDTIDNLFVNGKTPTDVLWVGDKNFHTDWANFEKVANFEYEDIGGGNIYSGLMVVGADWWLERNSDDVYEWWEFKTLPVKPVFRNRLINLVNGYHKNDMPFEIWKGNV